MTPVEVRPLLFRELYISERVEVADEIDDVLADWGAGLCRGRTRCWRPGPVTGALSGGVDELHYAIRRDLTPGFMAG